MLCHLLWDALCERYNGLGAKTIIQLFWKISSIFLLACDGCWHLRPISICVASDPVLNSKETVETFCCS